MDKWWGWALVALAACAPALAQDTGRQVDVDQYLRADAYKRIKISPDGRHFAATVELGDRGGLVVLRREDLKIVASAGGDKGSQVRDFWWANDERVVMSMAEHLGSRDQPYATGQLFSLGLDKKGVKLLAGGLHGAPVLLGGQAQGWEMVDLIDALPDDPRHVLVSAWDDGPEPRTRVDQLDVYNGTRTRVATAPVKRADFITDASGQVRFAAGANQANASQLYYRENAQAQWRLLNDEAQSHRVELPVGFAADGVTAYLQVEQATGPDSIVAFNTATGERKPVLTHPTADPYALIHEADGRTLVGATYMADGVSSLLLDEKSGVGRLQRVLERTVPGAAVDITSFTADGSQALVQVWSDTNPGDVYVVDTRALDAKALFAHRKWIPRETLATTRAITLPARDGMALHGYLTLPRGAKEPAPMIVLPHGGPYGEFDTWEYDDEVQLLADAGYAVLRLNYRGSGNHGRAYRLAGARQWGASMQDDLTDATRWAIAQKFADASRICIYGASYGGYAALMGVAREPALYRCAVGYVGVYDLEMMHRQTSRTTGWLHQWMDDWVGERKDLDARSPVLMADQIKVPVMLAAGGNDQTAPIAHSRQMERALRQAGVPVETLYFESEGHGFYDLAHRREFYVRLLDFLHRRIGGARAAPADGEREGKKAGG